MPAISSTRKQDFRYVAAEDVYVCPAGQRLAYSFTTEDKGLVLRRYWTNACQSCVIKHSRFGGERPWFVCSVASNGVYCGRRVTKLYGAGRLFACRHCYRLAYASQQESAHQRGLGKSQKIRMQLGGSPNMLEEFPEKPKGMHWRTYERWRRVHDAAEERSTIGLMGFVERLGRRSSRCA